MSHYIEGYNISVQIYTLTEDYLDNRNEENIEYPISRM